jgi:hypothetical protein
MTRSGTTCSTSDPCIKTHDGQTKLGPEPGTVRAAGQKVCHEYWKHESPGIGALTRSNCLE